MFSGGSRCPGVSEGFRGIQNVPWESTGRFRRSQERLKGFYQVSGEYQKVSKVFKRLLGGSI